MPDINNTNTKDWAAVAAKAEAEEKIELEKKAAQMQAEQKNAEIPEIEQLSAAECEIKLNAAEKKADDYMNKYMRLMADLENVQRRADRDIANAHKFAIEKFAFELLTVADNLERTLEVEANGNDVVKNIYVGVELTLKVLLEALQKFGITQINPVGDAFNHDLHSAVSVREDNTVKPGTVVQVLQKGYLLKERLLRPAMVIVSKS